MMKAAKSLFQIDFSTNPSFEQLSSMNYLETYLPKQKLHWPAKSFKVYKIIEGSLVSDMPKNCHSNYCIDKSDES